MKYVIWDYNESCYINYKCVAISFKTEKDAEEFINDLIKVEKARNVFSKKEIFEYREEYLIEETK